MTPLDALYTDLRNLGRVFDVEDRAEKLVAKFRKQVAGAQAGRRGAPGKVPRRAPGRRPITAGQ